MSVRRAGRAVVLSGRLLIGVKPLQPQTPSSLNGAWNARTREAVRRFGAHVAGDLDDLPMSQTENMASAVDGTQRRPSDDELLEAAQAAIAGIRRLINKQRRRAAKRNLAADAAPDRTRSNRPPWSAEPVGAAVAEIADLCRASIELRRRIQA